MPTGISHDMIKAPSGHAEAALSQTAPELYKRFVDLQTKVIEVLAPRQQAKEDTESGINHLYSVQKLIDRLVPAEKFQKYSPIELFVLLSAIYLHDIGKLLRAIGKSDAHHAIKGRDGIVEFAKELGLEEPEALSIGYVVEGHGIDRIENLPERTGVYPYGVIRIRYFSALLKLADDLDMCFTRASRIARALIQPDEDIDPKWRLRQSIWNVDIQPGSWYIEVQAVPRTLSEHSAVLREIDIINGRLNGIRTHLRATPDIGLYYSVVDLCIDDHWIRDAKKTEPAEITSPGFEERPIVVDLPENTTAVILRYDPSSVALYHEVMSPCLKEGGYNPVLIDTLPPETTLLERTIEVIQSSHAVIVLFPQGGGPSEYFRLGVAMGLRKKIIAFTNSSTTTISDLCGMSVCVFENEDDLRQQLTAKMGQLQ